MFQLAKGRQKFHELGEQRAMVCFCACLLSLTFGNAKRDYKLEKALEKLEK